MIISIELSHLCFLAHHGVFENERKVGNMFIVDFSADYEVSDDFCSDNLDDTVSYADIYEVIQREMQTPSALLEHVAARVVHQTRKHWPQFVKIDMRIEKVRPPIRGIDGNAAVSLKWEKAE